MAGAARDRAAEAAVTAVTSKRLQESGTASNLKGCVATRVIFGSRESVHVVKQWYRRGGNSGSQPDFYSRFRVVNARGGAVLPLLRGRWAAVAGAGG